MKPAQAVLLALLAGSGLTSNALNAQAPAPAAAPSIGTGGPRLPTRPEPPPASIPVSVRLPVPLRVPEDAWFGGDKLRHAGTSAAIQLMGYGLLRLAGASGRGSLVGASVVTAAVGIGKEVHDARTGGDPSARDLVWDGIGLIAGAGLSRLGDGR